VWTLLLVVPAGLLVVLLGIPAPLWLLVLTAFVGSACLSVTNVVWFATLQEKIPERSMSRISSFDWFGSVALNPIGYALVGPLAASIGVGRTLVLAGALNLASTASMLGVPSVRELRAGPEADDEPPGAQIEPV
jgi:hypothetical protein